MDRELSDIKKEIITDLKEQGKLEKYDDKTIEKEIKRERNSALKKLVENISQKWVIRKDGMFLKTYTIYDNGKADFNFEAWEKGVIVFDDKEKAEAVALLIDGEVQKQ